MPSFEPYIAHFVGYLLKVAERGQGHVVILSKMGKLSQGWGTML